MTTRSINNQVQSIKSATEKATSSKEAAIAFLLKAGIIDSSGSHVIKSVKAKTPSDSKDWKVTATSKK